MASSNPGPRSLYVYGVLRAKEELHLGAMGLGVSPGEVETVHHGELAAVVSEVPPGMPDPTRENVLTHHHVQEAVMRQHTLLPAAFGLVLRGREEVVELLRTAHDALVGVLTRLEGHLELGLKVLWDQDLLAREAAKHDAQEILEVLRPHVTAMRVVSPIGERMILNAAFLVARDREAAFDAKLRSLVARFELLTFQYTGPWAPYHFADVRLRWEPEATGATVASG
jgi:hypothetical protein